ncbi:hypothetical protein HD806DRAFT_511055 [Xylariaceae sp. AK1471]|nr:hypothetical protein HD806DRAFT_511055 [Xylariaceae sp. AK1471]
MWGSYEIGGPSFTSIDGWEKLLTQGGPYAPTGEPSADAIRLLFSRTAIDDSTDFHQHPVTKMLVNYLKLCLGAKYVWDNKPISDTIFPGLDPNGSPGDLGINGAADICLTGARGLLVKAIYNATPDIQDTTSINKATDEISSFNSWDTKSTATNLFVKWFQFVAKISPTPKATDMYISLITNPAWRALRASAATRSAVGWPNPGLEIYLHFVKLRACGASDEQIQSVYNTITTSTDALDPSLFSEITPQTWQDYSGWRTSGTIDTGDMNAQNLDAKRETIIIGLGNATATHIRLAHQFILDNDYYHYMPFSCFRGSALVVLADGKTKPISQVSAGDVVLTTDASCIDSPQQSLGRAVAFASEVPRAKRTLYAFKDSEIWFTHTHPIVQPDGSLGFVDPMLAMSFNPSWSSVKVTTLHPDLLRSEPHDQVTSAPNEKLYDLVFEHSIDMGSDHNAPLTYVLQDPASLKHLLVASEAPVGDWFPLSTSFIHGMIKTIVSGQQNRTAKSNETSHVARDKGNEFLSLTALLTITMEDLRYSTTAAEILESLAGIDTEIDNSYVSSLESVSLAKLMSIGGTDAKRSLNKDQERVQSLAQMIERLSTSLSRTLENSLRSGWAYLLPPTDVVPMLFIDTLHLDPSVTISTAGPALLGVAYSTVSGRRTTMQHAEICMEGTQTIKFHAAVNVAELDIDSHGFAVMHIKISFLDDSQHRILYSGRLHLARASPSVFMLGSLGRQTNPGVEDHMATLMCKLVLVPQQVLELEKPWHQNRHACMVKYAHEVGSEFGKSAISSGVFGDI